MKSTSRARRPILGQSELSVRKQERQEVDLDDEFESDSMPEVDDPRAMADGQDQTNGVNPPGPANNDFASQEELLRAYRATESRLVEKEREAEEYRSILEQMGAGTRRLQVQADEETFIKEARESYQKDPVAAFMMMLTKARNEFRDTVEERIGQVFQEEHEFKRLLADFLNDPANSSLKPYEEQMELLMKDKGFHAQEAADLLRKIDGKRELAGRMRSAAAREIRNRSAVETGGEVGEPVDKDKEFYRIMKKAKTLEDMFDGLRKAGAA